MSAVLRWEPRRMDRIAYHPIRVCQHASLFLPLSEDELKTYQTESVNTLRKYPPTDRSLALSGTHPSELPRPTTTAANHPVPASHPPSDAGSPPVGYSTPSPLPIPLGSLPAEHRPNLPSNKRPLQATQDHPQDPNSFQLNMTHSPAIWVAKGSLTMQINAPAMIPHHVMWLILMPKTPSVKQSRNITT